MRNKPERIFIDKLNHYSYKYIELKEGGNHHRFNTPEIQTRNRPSIRNSLDINSPNTKKLGVFDTNNANNSFDHFV